MRTARLKVTEDQKKKPRRQREEAGGQVGKRDAGEEAKREGRTREWRGRCGTKRDKREVCLQSDRRSGLGRELRGRGQNQKRMIMVLSRCSLKDAVLLCGEG